MAKTDPDAPCALHGPQEVTGLRLQAGERLTLRAEAMIDTTDKGLIGQFIGAHRERYAHDPLVTLFLARDWFQARGCVAVVRPVLAARLLTRLCTSLQLAFVGFLWKRVGMALFRGQTTCECCAESNRKELERQGADDD